jgi:poly-beta-1,6-N-acetyl-D-glucosamine synthase
VNTSGHLGGSSIVTESVKYAIITPIRDEERHIEATLRAVIDQSITPSEWVIVDDGSSDRTGDIIDRYAAQVPWIHVVHRKNRGFRKAGGGVIDAFYAGYDALQCTEWQFIVKLDGDLTFGREYFEHCFQHFGCDPRLGIGGGDIYHATGVQLKLEKNPRFHVRGATKIYKRDCWNAIGGLWRAAGWDTIDEVKANMLGWRTYSFDELRVLHHRFTGQAEGQIRDRVKHGTACYISGYHPLFVLASCVARLFKKPYVLGSAAIAYGFVKGYIERSPRVTDSRLIGYVRAQQLRRLCGLQTIWK